MSSHHVHDPRYVADVSEFEVSIPDGQLIDLQRRLDATRWPERETVTDFSQGVPLAELRELCDHWRHRYDWRRCEARLNALGQFRTVIDGLDIHFMHVRSAEPEALPLLITHGWPGSIIEFMKVVGPLTDPVRHGGSPSDAFHVIAPSLPGYGFSAKPSVAGWGPARIASAWINLMERLGFRRWVAQGGDWGSMVTTAIGAAAPPGCAAVHVNMPWLLPTADELAELTAEEQQFVERRQNFVADGSGYSGIQRTRPQTLGYALTDSPAGQAAWIFEKLRAWTDDDGSAGGVLTVDEILDNIMLYWLPASAASSARLYWEARTGIESTRIELPAGVSIFPKELLRPSRRWAERRMPNLIHWRELDRGGHFAAWEQPDLFVGEMRDCFRVVR